MKFPSMLRILRNTQGGMGSTAKSASTPYTPYTDPPPDEPSTLEVTVTAKPPSVYRGVRVTFTGRVENAPEGVTLSYSWTFGEGATDTQGINDLISSCKYDTLGEKTVTLTVSDGNTVLGSGSVTITVGSPPLPWLWPVARAGMNQVVALGSEVSFSGADSTSPYGGSLTYSWDFGADADPPASNAEMPFCIYRKPGTKTVTLTVADSTTELTHSDDVTIKIKPLPEAEAGDDQIVGVNQEVSFDGSGSTGIGIDYSWAFGDEENPTAVGDGVMPSYTYTTKGTKTVTLTVTDRETGLTDSDTVTITVRPPPEAKAGSDQLAAVNQEVSFDGSGSIGTNLSYSWAFGDEKNPTAVGDGVMPSYTYTTKGTKTVSLTVTDEDTGFSHSDTVTITVIDVGVTVTGAPRVVAVTPLTRVTFESSVENAPESATFRYSWSFDDGAIFLKDYGSTASCQYNTPGNKMVKLTVGVTLDGQTVEVEGTCVIKVFKVNDGRHQIVAVGDTVNFEGTVSNVPEDVTPIYSWAFGDGATNAKNHDGLTPSCSYTTAGEKIVKLTVSFTIDGESVEGSGTVKITVLESRLRVQGARTLSDLEQDAFDLVFGDSITPPKIEIVEHIPHTADTGGAAGKYDSARDVVVLARDRHIYTEDLNGNSTRANTDIFKPGNMKFLNTFIHECTHHWQILKNRYGEAGPSPSRYDFTREELRNLNLLKEQHASAAATWFVIGWQIEYRDEEVEPMINLTEKPEENNVGKVFRYAEIDRIPHDLSNSRYPGRWVPRESEEDLSAEDLSAHFTPLLTELRAD